MEKENTCVNLTDIYTRKLRIVEKLDRIRKNFVPVEHNQFRNLNKKLERPYSPWDYILEEVKLIALDFKEERKWKVAMGFHLSKTAKKYFKQKKAKGKEMTAFHRLISSELASMVYKEFERHWEIKVAERKANAELLEDNFKSEKLGPVVPKTDLMLTEGHDIEMNLPKLDGQIEEEEEIKLEGADNKVADKQSPSKKDQISSNNDKPEMVLEKMDSVNDICLSREDLELKLLSKELNQREELLDVDVLGLDTSKNLMDENALLLSLKTSENEENKRRNLKSTSKKRESGLLHQSSFGPFSSNFGRVEARVKPELEKFMSNQLESYGIQEKEEIKKVDKVALVHELKKIISRWPKNKTLNFEVVGSIISSFFQIPNSGVGELLNLSRSNSITSAIPPLASSFSYSGVQNYNNSQQLLLKSSNSTSSLVGDNSKKRKKNLSSNISSFQAQPPSLIQSVSVASGAGPNTSSQQNPYFSNGLQNMQSTYQPPSNGILMMPPYLPQSGAQMMNSQQIPAGAGLQTQQPAGQQTMINGGLKEGIGGSTKTAQEGPKINIQDPNVIKKLKIYENMDEILTLTYDEQTIADGEYSKLFQVTYENMNNMPKLWEEVPTYKMYDYLPIEPLYYMETTFEDTVEDVNLGNINLESAIEDYGAKMESLFNSKSTNNANTYIEAITQKRNNKEDINFIEFIKVFPKLRENHLFIHSDSSKQGNSPADTKFRIFKSPTGAEKGYMGLDISGQGYTPLSHLDWPPHMYYLLEKYINMFGNKWSLIMECMDINLLSKGFKINEKICLERWFNLNFKRKKKILQLDSVIYPNYTFFEADELPDDVKDSKETIKDSSNKGPCKSNLEKNGEINTLENKGNILFRKSNSFFNNEPIIDFSKEPKNRNYKKYCLPMRRISEVKIYQKNLSRSKGNYDDKFTEKVPSMWQSQMAVMQTEKMKLLNENLLLNDITLEKSEKMTIESIKALFNRSDEARNPATDMIKPESKKEFDIKMKRMLPLTQLTRRKKQIDRNSPIIQTINNQRKQMQYPNQMPGVNSYQMNKMQVKLPPNHQQMAKQGQPPSGNNIMPQGQMPIHPQAMNSVPNQVMGGNQGPRDIPYLKVLGSGNMNPNMHEVGQVMPTGNSGSMMPGGYSGPNIPNQNYQNIPKGQPPNNMPVGMDNKYPYNMSNQQIQQQNPMHIQGIPNMNQPKQNIVPAQPFQNNYPNPNQNQQSRLPVGGGNYSSMPKKDKMPYPPAGTQNTGNMYGNTNQNQNPPIANQNPQPMPSNANPISRTGSNKGEERPASTKQSKKK